VDKRQIRILVLGITLGLAGLVVLQVIWMRNTMRLKEERFRQEVGNALITVSERLERLEKFKELRKHEAGRRLLLRLDTLRRPQQHEPRSASGSEQQDPLPRYDSLQHPANEQWPLRMEEHEALVAGMVRSILVSRWGTDARDRVDPQQLEELLQEEFAAHALPLDHHHGIFTKEGEAMLVPVGSRDVEQALRASPHRERLYRYDLVGPELYLHVHIPDEQQVLLQGLLPLMIAPWLFVLLVALAFLQTMRTVVRQKRINDIRNDLVNNLTHELKTPISTISLACEALTDPSVPKDEDQARTYVNMIRDENKRLGSLVENVLQSAVLDSGHMLLKRVDLDLHRVLQDVVRSSSMQVSRRNGRVELDLKAEIHHLQGDRIHLTNLLYNLIDNAVKYSEKEPRIRIVTRSNNEGIFVEVSDNGIGIARSEQAKIFDKLYRVPTGNIHNAKGFGLGLSYVRTVVERHGGRIEVDSEPGRGSTFKIFIPFEHVREQQSAAGRG
jgi:two-component system, OmpR family, phosphate regulon sensor histidine kinase PhoR